MDDEEISTVTYQYFHYQPLPDIVNIESKTMISCGDKIVNTEEYMKVVQGSVVLHTAEEQYLISSSKVWFYVRLEIWIIKSVCKVSGLRRSKIQYGRCHFWEMTFKLYNRKKRRTEKNKHFNMWIYQKCPKFIFQKQIQLLVKMITVTRVSTYTILCIRMCFLDFIYEG